MNKPLYMTALLAALALSVPSWTGEALATSASGSPSGSSFGAGNTTSSTGGTSASGNPSGSSFGAGNTSSSSGGTSATGGASGSSFGSGTIGTDRIDSDDDEDGTPDALDPAPENDRLGGADQVDTDNDGVSDASDPTPTIPDGDATNTNVDGSVDADGSIGTTAAEEAAVKPAIETQDEITNSPEDEASAEPGDFQLRARTDLPHPNHPDDSLIDGEITVDDNSVNQEGE